VSSILHGLYVATDTLANLIFLGRDTLPIGEQGFIFSEIDRHIGTFETPHDAADDVADAIFELRENQRFLRAAHLLHEAMREATRLNCSIGVATSRLVAKISSDQAKPNGVLRVMPGQEARFLAPLDVRKVPGVGKVTEKNLHALGIVCVGDLAKLEESFLEERFGKWGLALAGKARGADAGGWFDTEVGEDVGPKSISHEHTFDEDTADQARLESTLMRLSEMVARRLREHGLHARTLQLKLRDSAFHTITRAHTLAEPTQIDKDIFEQIRALFRANWKAGTKIRLLGVQTSSFESGEGQLSLLDSEQHNKWKQALSTADKLRDRYGEGAVGLASGMKSGFRERTHENPTGLPGKKTS